MGAVRSVVNIGAGTGSYEPTDLDVVAVEPSREMIRQRPESAAPVLQAVAEQLPFADGSFDLAMGVLTLHHWSDWRQGLAEASRVAGGNVLLFTWFGDRGDFWLTDYFPEFITMDNERFPSRDEYADVLGDLTITPFPLPHDLRDGFMYSYWRRPEAYLDPGVRQSISSFALISDPDPGLQKLEADLASGRWQEKYGDLLTLEEYDHGYALVHSHSG